MNTYEANKYTYGSTSSASAVTHPQTVQGVRECGRFDVFDLQKLLHHLMAKAFPILLTAALIAAAAGVFALSTSTAPSYAATAKLYTISNGNIADAQMSTVMSADYIELFKTWEIHEAVRQELRIDYPDSVLNSMLSVSIPENSHLLYITITAPDPETAVVLANAYCKVVQTMTVEKMNLAMPSFFSQAVSAKLVPSGIPFTTMVVCGFLLGLIFACGLVGLLTFLDRKPRIPEDLESSIQGCTVGLLAKTVTKEKKKKKNKSKTPIPADDDFINDFGVNVYSLPIPEDGYLAGMEQMCTTLLRDHKGCRTYMVTSRYAGEGKTTTATALMKQLGAANKNVCLLDLDLRTSDKSQYALKKTDKDTKFLQDFLNGKCDPEDIVFPVDFPNGYIVPMNPDVPMHLDMLNTPAMTNLMDSLKQYFDLILIDTPAAGIYPDASVLARFCDEALLVVEYNRGTCNDLPLAVQNICSGGCHNISAIINKIPFRTYLPRMYYYSSEHYKRYRSKKISTDIKG